MQSSMSISSIEYEIMFTALSSFASMPVNQNIYI